MSNAEDIRVGDRFEALCDFAGGVCRGQVVEVSRQGIYEPAWLCKDAATGLSLPGWFVLDDGWWRRVPRGASTIEERRAALRPGDVIRDQALLAKGMRVEGGGVLCPRTIGDNGRPTEGGYNFNHNAAAWKRLVREIGVRFLGWEPSLDELAALGERRAALKAGDVITDPALLAKGMRVKFPMYPDGVQWEDDGVPASYERTLALIADGECHFLGWGQAAKLAERCPVILQPSGEQCALKADLHVLHVTEAEREGVGMPAPAAMPLPSWWRSEAKLLPDLLQPAAFCWPLPFKRHPKCAEIHGTVMCVVCEVWIAASMKDDDEAAASPPRRPEPHQLAPSGLGGTVGPVLSRLR